MDNLNDLKSIWLTAKTDTLPSSQEVVQLAEKFRKQKLIKKWVLIALACFLGNVMIWISFTIKSELITTRLGEIMIVAAAGLLAATNISSIRRFYRANNFTNKEFLQFIEQTRLNQIHYYKKVQFLGMLLSSVGLLLFLYEPVRLNTVLLITVYSFATVYLAIIWFVIRPKKFKKAQTQLTATKERLEKISTQLK